MSSSASLNPFAGSAAIITFCSCKPSTRASAARKALRCFGAAALRMLAATYDGPSSVVSELANSMGIVKNALAATSSSSAAAAGGKGGSGGAGCDEEEQARGVG